MTMRKESRDRQMEERSTDAAEAGDVKANPVSEAQQKAYEAASAATWKTLLASLDEETLHELGARIAPIINRELGRMAVNERFS